MTLIEGEDEHNKGGTTSGWWGCVKDKIEIKIEEDEDKKDKDKKGEESEDEEEVEAEYQNLVKKVLDDYIDVSTRYGYRLTCNQRRILEFLYFKSKRIVSKKKGNFGVEAHKLPDDDLVVALDAVEVPGSKLYVNKLREVAKEHLDKAGPNYLPLDLNRLTPKMFLDYLLSLSDIKKNEYMKLHGEHRSALTQLCTRCEIAPTKIFLQKIKQVHYASYDQYDEL